MEKLAKWYKNLWNNHLIDMRRLPEFKTLLRERGLLEFWRTTNKKNRLQIISHKL